MLGRFKSQDVCEYAFTIKTMTLPSLFAGKMHALLCRTIRTDIKGRDWYDLIWFVKNNIPCDLHIGVNFSS
jgi:hypothetical protein